MHRSWSKPKLNFKRKMKTKLQQSIGFEGSEQKEKIFIRHKKLKSDNIICHNFWFVCVFFFFFWVLRLYSVDSAAVDVSWCGWNETFETEPRNTRCHMFCWHSFNRRFGVFSLPVLALFRHGNMDHKDWPWFDSALNRETVRISNYNSHYNCFGLIFY